MEVEMNKSINMEFNTIIDPPANDVEKDKKEVIKELKEKGIENLSKRQKARIADINFGQARRKLDSYLHDKKDRENLKEVWDD
jgi:hypothetical protein